MATLSFEHGMVLALDGPRKTTRQGGVSADGRQLKPIRFDNGEPVYRFRVEAIPGGKFLTADEQPFQVTPQTLQHWQQTFAAFANRGIPVPVLTGTHLEPTAEHSVGQVVGVDVKNGSLWCTCELIGKDIPRLAATNSVSIYAEPSWTDAKGNQYDWPLRHLLMTPDPRIPGLKGFTPLAASNGKVFNVPVLRYKNMNRPIGLAGCRPSAGKSCLTPVALDDNGLGVPGVGDGAMLPGGPADQGSTAGDPNAGQMEAGTQGLKQQIKDHFVGHAHTVLDDDQMEHSEKLEAMKELLSECEKILDAFTDEESQDQGQEQGGEENEMPEDHDQGEEVDTEGGERGAAMDNESSEEGEPDGGILSKIGKTAMKVAPAAIAALNNMPQLREAIGPRDAQLAQLTSRLRRGEIEALWLSGKITPKQKKQLEDQFLAANHVALSLSNATFGNSFDQAISLLASNESHEEQTGIQGDQAAGIALTNQYTRTQQDAAQAEKDEADYIKPSSQRVSKNGKK